MKVFRSLHRWWLKRRIAARLKKIDALREALRGAFGQFMKTDVALTRISTLRDANARDKERLGSVQ